MKRPQRVRLKDMKCISDTNIDYTSIMVELFGYKNNWYHKKFKFKKTFKKAYNYMSEVRNIDPKKIVWTEECSIVKPISTDYISFRAMMELQALLNDSSEEHIVDLMAKVIAIVCYQENVKGKYKSTSNKFIEFRERIYNEPLLEMIGLYNLLMDQLDSSTEEWNRRFFSVEIKDIDYDLANRGRLAQFNVINTIKTICQDFNIKYEEAWQMSYNLVQTNSYAKATANHVQDQMRQLKESKMKKSRARG